jgi:hypothetical protein
MNAVFIVVVAADRRPVARSPPDGRRPFARDLSPVGRKQRKSLLAHSDVPGRDCLRARHTPVRGVGIDLPRKDS